MTYDLKHAWNHFQTKVANCPVTMSPYPHLSVEDAFPESYYSEMLRQFPSIDIMPPAPKGLNEIELSTGPSLHSHDGSIQLEVALADRPERIRFWRDWYDNLERTLTLSLYRALGISERDLDPSQFWTYAVMAVNGPAAALLPHRDQKQNYFTYLFYLPETADDEQAVDGGTVLYAPKSEAAIESMNNRAFDAYQDLQLFSPEARALYLPNRMVSWPNHDVGLEPTDMAVHGFHQTLEFERKIIKGFIRFRE